MQKQISFSLSVILLLASVGCSSAQPVPEVRKPVPAPAAWAMLPAPDLQTPLNGIISPSESELKQ